jgi:hypothetical protein
MLAVVLLGIVDVISQAEGFCLQHPRVSKVRS